MHEHRTYNNMVDRQIPIDSQIQLQVAASDNISVFITDGIEKAQVPASFLEGVRFIRTGKNKNKGKR